MNVTAAVSESNTSVVSKKTGTTTGNQGTSGNSADRNQSNQPSDSSTGSKKKQNGLHDIFVDCLKDIYSAENQLVKAFPEVIEACYTEDLEDAFRTHLQQTRKQIERLDKVFSRLGIERGEKKCAAMEGLIKEMQEVISNFDESPARDSALIIGAQKIEHYEIASYGSLCELADVLGYHQAADLLERNLQEEGDTDHLLTDIAMDVNDDAIAMDNEHRHK